MMATDMLNDVKHAMIEQLWEVPGRLITIDPEIYPDKSDNSHLGYVLFGWTELKNEPSYSNNIPFKMPSYSNDIPFIIRSHYDSSEHEFVINVKQLYFWKISPKGNITKRTNQAFWEGIVGEGTDYLHDRVSKFLKSGRDVTDKDPIKIFVETEPELTEFLAKFDRIKTIKLPIDKLTLDGSDLKWIHEIMINKKDNFVTKVERTMAPGYDFLVEISKFLQGHSDKFKFGPVKLSWSLLMVGYKTFGNCKTELAQTKNHDVLEMELNADNDLRLTIKNADKKVLAEERVGLRGSLNQTLRDLYNCIDDNEENENDITIVK